jgi:Ca2+-transporting ATPase
MRTFSQPPAEAWHNLSADAALERLSSSRSGLDQAEARRRLDEVGPNRLKPPQPVPALRILADQFKSVVVYLLIAAAGISFALGDRIEAAAIAVVLVINTLIGFLTELRARRAMEGLLQFDVSHATVIREGQLAAVDATTIVPGDLIRVDSGRRVPADARLIESADLRTDEAALTGESLPVSKDASAQLDKTTGLADRINIVYKGTTVVGGTAIAVVMQTGSSTEIGRIGTLVGTIERSAPAERRLDELGRSVWLALAWLRWCPS